MKCLMKYEWVKLMRSHLPDGKGLLGCWAKLASRAAFRKGYAEYCCHRNLVEPGMWTGGVVGLKSILQTERRTDALQAMDRLADLDLIRYEIRLKSKKLTYSITDWVAGCSGAVCVAGATCTTDGYGFVCVPRDLPDRLIEKHFILEEADAWLDLWCHTTSEDPDNAFSFLAPTVQYGRYGAVISLETLGQRWGWEKTKVWRFFKKHGDVFSLYRLPGSYGCLVFNRLYPSGQTVRIPTREAIDSVIRNLYRHAKQIGRNGCDRDYLNRLTALYSRKVSTADPDRRKNRVALLRLPIRAYLSLCRNCGMTDDCGRICMICAVIPDGLIRGPCAHIGKGEYQHERPKENICRNRS